MELPECCYRVSVKALVLDESRGRFLLTREKRGVWELPGGGVEHGMDVAEELKREVMEEMGVAVESVSDNPCYFFVVQNPKGMWIANVLYETSLKSLSFVPSDECEELQFVTAAESLLLPTNANVQKLAHMFDPALHRVQAS